MRTLTVSVLLMLVVPAAGAATKMQDQILKGSSPTASGQIPCATAADSATWQTPSACGLGSSSYLNPAVLDAGTVQAGGLTVTGAGQGSTLCWYPDGGGCQTRPPGWYTGLECDLTAQGTRSFSTTSPDGDAGSWCGLTWQIKNASSAASAMTLNGSGLTIPAVAFSTYTNADVSTPMFKAPMTAICSPWSDNVAVRLTVRMASMSGDSFSYAGASLDGLTSIADAHYDAVLEMWNNLDVTPFLQYAVNGTQSSAGLAGAANTVNFKIIQVELPLGYNVPLPVTSIADATIYTSGLPDQTRLSTYAFSLSAGAHAVNISDDPTQWYLSLFATDNNQGGGTSTGVITYVRVECRN